MLNTTQGNYAYQLFKSFGMIRRGNRIQVTDCKTNEVTENNTIYTCRLNLCGVLPFFSQMLGRRQDMRTTSHRAVTYIITNLRKTRQETRTFNLFWPSWFLLLTWSFHSLSSSNGLQCKNFNIAYISFSSFWTGVPEKINPPCLKDRLYHCSKDS